MEASAVKYVDILRSISSPERHYTGSTSHFANRLKAHNAGHVHHTAKCIPWEPVMVLAFAHEERAAEFERYLKSGSGRAFAQKHFR
jgi:predicted GIY-YIG superfamily endonuclease